MSDNIYRKRLAEAVRARRATLDLTQKELADIAEVSEPTVVKIEKGDVGSVKLDTIQKVCKALGVPLGMVINGREVSI